MARVILVRGTHTRPERDLVTGRIRMVMYQAGYPDRNTIDNIGDDEIKFLGKRVRRLDELSTDVVDLDPPVVTEPDSVPPPGEPEPLLDDEERDGDTGNDEPVTAIPSRGRKGRR